MKNREDRRTTVSLAEVAWTWAEELMDAKGFNDNFSAYVADLIRRDREREEANRTPARIAKPPAVREARPAPRKKAVTSST